jgi:hypothetical protein
MIFQKKIIRLVPIIQLAQTFEDVVTEASKKEISPDSPGDSQENNSQNKK